MDFVVVGFGLGALGVLLGVLMLGWLAGRSERAAASASSPAAATYDLAAAAECRGAGQAFLYAGGALILATIGGLAGALDDRTGALLVATVATVGALGIFVWSFLYRTRHPMPPRPRRQVHHGHEPAASAAVMESPRSAVTSSAAASVAAGAAATTERIGPFTEELAADPLPVSVSNGSHDVAADAVMTQSDIDIKTASEPELEPEERAPALDGAEPPLQEFAAAADTHPVNGAEVSEDAVAAAAPSAARESEARATSGEDDDASQRG